MALVSVQEAIEILKAHGTIVNEDEARAILEFMTELARISLSQYLDHEDSRPIHPGEHGRTSR